MQAVFVLIFEHSFLISVLATMKSYHPCTILIVDSKKSNIDGISKLLINTHYTIISSGSVPEAKQSLERTDIKGIIVNEETGVEQTLQFCRDIRNNELTHDIPVLILSETIENGHSKELMNLQSVDVIRSPLNQTELIMRLGTVTELKKAHELISNQYYEIEEQRVDLDIEKKKTRNLLQNILPAKVVEKLEKGGESGIEYFQSATIMFTDFKNFSRTCELLSPDVLVHTLETYFTNFDSIIEQFNIEKIKTIGDSYMVAGGVPVENNSHAIEVVLAALEICYFIKCIKKEYRQQATFL
jgi:response regulator RpfG family c-di-GMP phosphodiesterase